MDLVYCVCLNPCFESLLIGCVIGLCNIREMLSWVLAGLVVLIFTNSHLSRSVAGR